MLAMAAAICTFQAGAETVEISDAEDWAAFAARVNNGETALDAELTADVTLAQDSPRVGDSVEHPYAGSFNGNSHKLTLNWNSSGVECLAPFGYVSGAKISDLHTAGTIVSDRQFASGLIGESRPKGATITRCRSSVSITSTVSGDATIGGFVGRTYWESQVVELKNCLFDGSLLVADGTNIGGFVGFNFNATGLRIDNSLFAPENIVVSEKTGSSTFSRHQGNSVRVSSCYYTASLDENQGTDASAMTPEQLAEALGGAWSVSDGKPIPSAAAFEEFKHRTGVIELLKNGEGGNTDGWTVYEGSWGRQTGNGSWFWPNTEGLSRLSQRVTLEDFGITADDLKAGVSVTASVTARCRSGSQAAYVKLIEVGNNGSTAETTLMDRAGEEFDETTYTTNITLHANTRILEYFMMGQQPENGEYFPGPAFKQCSLTTSRFSVSFVSEGAEVDKMYFSSIAALAGVTAPWPGNLWNHVFIGYYTQETGGEQIFASNCRYTNPAAWTPNGSATLYAHWRPRVVSFKFVSSGSTVGDLNYNFEGEAPTAPIPVRKGDYKFLGYYTESGVQVYDENGAFVASSASALTPDTTLYASWKLPEGSAAKLVYRGQLSRLTGEPATNDTAYEKTMHFRVYDSAEAATPLWKIDDQQVTVNADGSFVHMFGDETLAALIATGNVSHVGVAIGTYANTAAELKPRRELRSVAAVNRAITAEGAALDIRVGNLATENALLAADATVSHLEVAGTVTAPGAGKIEVSPLTVGAGERTQLLRGKGVKAFARTAPSVLVSNSGAVLRGAVLATAPADGVALVSSAASGERALRCPAVVQYCRAGESVRAPTSDDGGLKVTFFPFVRNDR